MQDLEKYRPDLYYSTFWDIDFNSLAGRGIENLIVDVDCTIAYRDSHKVDNRAAEALKNAMESGIIKKACLVSNIIFGKKREQRVWAMAEELKIPYVAADFFSRKPKPKPFLEGLKKMDAAIENTAVIGDQLFTDIAGGRSLGLFTVLVRPLGPAHWVTVFLLRRYMEKKILEKMGLKAEDQR